MNQNAQFVKSWIKAGIICGLFVSVVYPIMIFLPMPKLIQILLVMAVGPLLSISSVGLYYFITLHKKTISVSIAVIANIIAGVLFTTMLLVQIAIRHSKPAVIESTIQWAWVSIKEVHLGLDVALDVYIFLGTFFFAISIFNHPKFGKTFSIIGIIISISLITLNVISFPTPPADLSWIDLGPLLDYGIWPSQSV